MKNFFLNLNKASIQNIVAIITVLGAQIIMILLFYKGIPPENKDTVQLSLGLIVGAGIGSVYGFLYGMSKAPREQQPKKESE